MPYRRINNSLLFIVAATAVSSIWTSRRSPFLPHWQLALCSSTSSSNNAFNATCSLPHRFLGNTPSPFSNDFLPIRAVREVFDESLSTWASRTTRDFQLLDFTPENLTAHIALLRLLGISQISFADFGRVKGGKKCFLITLPSPTPSSEPHLVLSAEDVLTTILELNTSKPSLPSFDSSIPNALNHVKPYIRKNAENAICNGSLSAFYKQIGNASERELHAFCDALLGKTQQHHHEPMFKQLQAAQPLCRVYHTLIAAETCRSSAKPS